MELHGNDGLTTTTTHDFLSLRDISSTSTSSTTFPRREGFLLKTQNLLQPLDERAKQPLDINVPVIASPERPMDRVFYGGTCSFSMDNISARVFDTVVKSECGMTELDPLMQNEPLIITAAMAMTPAEASPYGRGAFTLSREKGFKELTVRTDSRNNNEQKPSTPRSKHSATEQRRRSRINDRFQILRDLIPHSDQKRDKASFLLEVIEYIQFLQEKVQKYETEFPGWNNDATNMMPWVKVFFRTFWENARQRNPRIQIDGVADPSQAIRNGHSPIGFINSMDAAVPAPTEPDIGLNNLGKVTPVAIPMQQTGLTTRFAQPQQISESENMAHPSQAQCIRSDAGSGEILDRNLAIDEGTINISSAYSQGLMNALAQSLQSSGVDLTQASITVQINLGRRASSKPGSAALVHGDPRGSQRVGHSPSGSSSEESERASKRQRLAKI